MKINREDMLELTRRMTSSRSHIMRLAGAYIDEEGYVDGTFNTNFLKLKGEERKRTLEIAKTIPFSRTNEELLAFPVSERKPGGIWQVLDALRDCELKNDALLLNLYEYIGENYYYGFPFAAYLYYGAYDIPVKTSDKAVLDGSEEVYRYLILALCPIDADLNAKKPFAGFLYPAFTDRSCDTDHVDLYSEDCDKEALEGVKLLLRLE
ncbi:MAG: DUF4317 family protein [Lachnospiraceae bacterium]|nr:DUF4317 family protein [Lachnospiraceae bacterium]